MPEFTINQALQKAIEAHRAGQVQEADRLYTAILKAQPKHPDANHNMGVLAAGVGKAEQALPFFKTALEASPATAQFWISYIDALIKLDKLADAKAVFDQAKSKGAKGDGFDKLAQRLVEAQGVSSNTYDVLRNKAIQFRENGEHERAIYLLKKGITQYPGNIHLITLLSHCLILNDELEEASAHLSEAKSLGWDIAALGWNEARLLLKQKNITKALSIAKKTFEKFPEDVEGMLVLGICLHVNNEIEESIVCLDKVISLKREVAEAHIHRGLIFLSQNLKTEALAHLEKAHKLKPHIKKLWDILVGLYIALERYPEAIQVLINMTQIDPSYEEGFRHLHLISQKANDSTIAIKSYTQILKKYPENSVMHVNLANAFQKQGKLEEALEAYNNALALKPDYAEVYNNIGIVLKDQGRFDEAIEAYNKAVALKPDYAEAYVNMGVVLGEDGKLEEAVAAYRNSVSIDPNNDTLYNNLTFLLLAIKDKFSSQEDLISYAMGSNDSNYFRINKAIINYRLALGGVNARKFLNSAINLLSTAKNASVRNLSLKNDPINSNNQLTDKVVALVHCGRSGTTLLHRLIDGQPEISTIPSYYFAQFFNHSTWDKIISGEHSKMADRFIEMYDVLFDARSSVPVEGRSQKWEYYVGYRDGMTNVGDHRDEVLTVDRDIFRIELQRLINSYDQLDAFLFFKLVHKAYDKTINDPNNKKIIFYHIHNPDTYPLLNFVRSAPQTNWLMMVREPVQSCESWVKDSFEQNKYFEISLKISQMLYEIDNIVYQQQNSIGVRLEDLKERPRQAIPAICDWMGIEETESLYETTAQGKKWWGGYSNPNDTSLEVNPFDKTTINRPTGLIFSESDQFVLRTLFYPFRASFGYVEENAGQFTIDLQTVRPMLDYMFGFEKTIVERTKSDPKKFMKSMPYRYLRSCLIGRWNTLNTFKTYPNMIKPLKIPSGSEGLTN